MVVNRWTKTFALGGTYMIPPWPTHARERLFRDNCFSYTRELRLLMNIFYIKRNAVDTGRTSIMHLNWPWIGVLRAMLMRGNGGGNAKTKIKSCQSHCFN